MYIDRSYEFINNDRLSLIIAETFKQYLSVFEEKKLMKPKNTFGNFSFINEVFQRCYLNDKDTERYFNTLINSQNDADYSRYTFFLISYLIENDNYDKAKKVTNNFDYLNSSILISQGKKWVEDKNLGNFQDIFLCTNSNDIVSELFFLIANLYSSQNNYEKSNFYLNIANYLNPKFIFNLSLLVENYYLNDDYSNTLKTLKVFDKKHEFYYWFKLKKESQIISKKSDQKTSLNFINKKFKAINQLKQSSTKKNSDFFQANLLLAGDSLKKKNFKKSKVYIDRSYEFINNDRLSLIIAETFKQYLSVFEEKKLMKQKNTFGNFSFINEVFQRCYLNDKDTERYFNTLINSQNDADYSRYTFFLISYLIENDNYDKAKKVTNNFDYLNSSVLISQGKKWIEDKNLGNFQDIFLCTNSNDIVSELFFLIANLYSSQNDYEKSNFYLNIANYLNPKFIFNLSLLAENYYLNDDYSNTLKTLKVFDKKHEFYYWFKLKKESQIILKKTDQDASLKFINNKFKTIKNPNKKLYLILQICIKMQKDILKQ